EMFVRLDGSIALRPGKRHQGGAFLTDLVYQMLFHAQEWSPGGIGKAYANRTVDILQSDIAPHHPQCEEVGTVRRSSMGLPVLNDGLPGFSAVNRAISLEFDAGIRGTAGKHLSGHIEAHGLLFARRRELHGDRGAIEFSLDNPRLVPVGTGGNHPHAGGKERHRASSVLQTWNDRA